MEKSTKTYPRRWEGVTLTTSRLIVPGGWIVTTWDYTDDGGVDGQSLVYVPDPKHEWVLKEYHEQENKTLRINEEVEELRAIAKKLEGRMVFFPTTDVEFSEETIVRMFGGIAGKTHDIGMLLSYIADMMEE